MLSLDSLTFYIILKAIIKKKKFNRISKKTNSYLISYDNLNYQNKEIITIKLTIIS